MANAGKTKKQLLEELKTLRDTVATLKKTEDAWRESEERYRSLFNGVPIGLYRSRTGGQFIDVNPALVKMLGYPDPETLMATSTGDVLATAEDREQLYRAEQAGGARNLELKLRRWDGTTIWVICNSHVVRDEQGRIMHYEGALQDFTERKQVEDTLQRTRQQLQDMFDNTPAAVYTKDMEGRYIFANRVFRERTGLGDQDVLGKTQGELFPHLINTLGEKWDPHEKRVLAGDQDIDFQETVGQTSGRVYLAIKFLLREADGNVYALCNSSLDITERVQTEEELQRYAARLITLHEIDRAILAAETPQAIAQAALAHIRRLIPCRRATVEIFDFELNERVLLAADINGTPKPEMSSRYPLDNRWIDAFNQNQAYVVPDIRAVSDPGSLLQSLAASGLIALAAIPLIVSGELLGSLNLMAVEPDAFRDEYLEIAREVANPLAIAIQQARLFEAEREQRLLAEALANTAAAVNATLDPNEVLDHILENLDQVVPHDTSSIMLVQGDEARVVRSRGFLTRGLTYVETYSASISDSRNLRAMVETRQPVIFEDMWEFPEWRSNTVPSLIRSYLGVPICSGETVVGFLNIDGFEPGMFTAAHARRMLAFADQVAVALRNARLYEQVQHHAEELEQRVEERTKELTAANQQLKQEITERERVEKEIIAANAQLRILSRMKDEFVSNVSHELRTPITNIKLRCHLLEQQSGRVEVHLSVIQRETDRLARTIEDLLTLSRMDQGRVSLNYRVIDLNLLTLQYVTDRVSLAESQELNMVFSATPDLPPVRVDSGLIGQALSILLTNALNYTPPGGHIMVNTQQRQVMSKRWAGITVSDTGPGIPPEEQKHLFERFFRGTAAHESGAAGTGLGLAILKQIMDQHQGQVEVASTGMPGEGATFTIWLPLEK